MPDRNGTARRAEGLALVALVAVLFAAWTLARADAPASPAPVAKAPGRVAEVLDDVVPGYVGSDACASCHAQAYADWKTSLHSYMEQAATPHSVIGDFSTDGVVLEVGQGRRMEMIREGDHYVIEAPGDDGKPHRYAIERTVGNRYKQRYLTKLPDGSYRVLPVQWNRKDHEYVEWLGLASGEPGTDGFWTAEKWAWQLQCAGCHTTGLDLGYDASDHTWHTRWKELAIGCEACHGPGLEHVKAGGGKGNILSPSAFPHDRQLDACGKCHSRGTAGPEQGAPAGLPGRLAYPYNMTPGTVLDAHYVQVTPEHDAKEFWPDGSSANHHQQLTDYRESDMLARGREKSPTCTTCHEPHRAAALKLPIENNALCLACHRAYRAAPALAAHTHHGVGPGEERRGPVRRVPHAAHREPRGHAATPLAHVLEPRPAAEPGRREDAERVPPLPRGQGPGMGDKGLREVVARAAPRRSLTGLCPSRRRPRPGPGSPASGPGVRGQPQQAPEEHDLPLVVRVVVRDQERLPHQARSVRVGQGGQEVVPGVPHERLHGRKVLEERGDGPVPRRGVGRRVSRRPVALGPGGRDVARVAAELQDVGLRDADVLEETPRRVGLSVGPDAAERLGPSGEGGLHRPVRAAAGEEVEEALTHGVVGGHGEAPRAARALGAPPGRTLPRPPGTARRAGTGQDGTSASPVASGPDHAADAQAVRGERAGGHLERERHGLARRHGGGVERREAMDLDDRAIERRVREVQRDERVPHPEAGGPFQAEREEHPPGRPVRQRRDLARRRVHEPLGPLVGRLGDVDLHLDRVHEDPRHAEPREVRAGREGGRGPVAAAGAPHGEEQKEGHGPASTAWYAGPPCRRAPRTGRRKDSPLPRPAGMEPFRPRGGPMAPFEVLSLIQPSGELHLGNYFGAVQGWVRLQDEHRCLFGVVDYHALTVPFEPARLRQRTWDMGLDLMACGLDPERSALIVQSLVPEHAELQWILGSITPYAWVAKMTQFKDKARQVEAAGASYSAGLFSYPVLQAADILIYKAARVPVGQDQDQHLELARDVARTFNRLFGETFPEPEALHTTTPKILSPADPTRKMSKSLGPRHVIGVFEEPAAQRKKIRSAVTDTGDVPADGSLSPGVEGLLTLLGAAGAPDAAADFADRFRTGDRRYAPLKDAVADAVVAATEPLRARRAELRADRARVRRVLEASSAAAREIARRTLAEVRERIGLPPPP